MLLPDALDYARWVEQTVDALRQGHLEALDVAHLIEEVEDWGKSQQQALKSNLRVLHMHLLKWYHQAVLALPVTLSTKPL